MSAYQPNTGAPCSCKRGVQRDNCPACEGTGMRIDFAAIRARSAELRLSDAFAAAFAAAGWVKCPRSGVAYHPAYDVGCGRCKPCVEAAEAVEEYKKAAAK